MIFKRIGDKIAELKKNKKDTPSPASAEGKKVSLLLDDLISLEGYVHDLFSFSPLPICFVSPANVVLEANPAFEKITNFRFEEIVGESITKIFEEGKITRLSEDVLKEDTVSGREMRIFPKEGEPLSVQAFAKARKNEKDMTIGFFLGVFDLTEINKTQDELKRSQIAPFNILEDTAAARPPHEAERAPSAHGPGDAPFLGSSHHAPLRPAGGEDQEGDLLHAGHDVEIVGQGSPDGLAAELVGARPLGAGDSDAGALAALDRGFG